MGYIRHHAIVVTASYGEYGLDSHWIDVAHAKALEIFHRSPTLHHEALGEVVAYVTEPTPRAVNNVRSFMIAPDGSKEGWDNSDIADEARAKFIAWLRAQAYEDGSSPLEWVEVQYGDDNWSTRVIDDSDKDRREAMSPIRPWSLARRSRCP